MDARCDIQLLGGLRVQQGERIITRFRTQKTAALLAYLAYHLDDGHPREVLAELLWPWSAPEAGRTTLRVALSSLRRQLEPPGVPTGAVIKADRFAVCLNRDAVTTDVTQFEAALESVETAGSASERTRWLVEAVEVYRGRLLPGYYQEWIFPEQERLADLYFHAVRLLTASLEEAGEQQGALDYARRAVACDQLREEAHQDVIRLLAAMGQQDAALRQYQELVQILDEELGETASPTTLQLVERISAAAGQQPVVQEESAEVAPLPRPTRAPPLPTGIVTFLLTDIEGSTHLAEQAKDAYGQALETHHRLLRQSFRQHNGHEVKELGDGFVVAFEHATDALACAADSQRALARQEWPKAIGELWVRMALYTGEVEVKQGEYRGLALHQASRVLTAGHGGQILCSEGMAGLVRRGLEPGIRLVDLGSYWLRDVETPERLFQVDYPEMAREDFPPLEAEPGYGSQLPLTFTRFVGREDELAWLQETLLRQGTRMVTLTGPGGSGKTRLAIEGARRLLEPFRGAVWFVSLQDLVDPALIPGAIADAMSLPRSAQSEPLGQAVEVLSRQRCLLVLDNLEHLVEDGATVVRALLGSAPTLKCLVTSRQCMNLDGESELSVAPLPTPTGEQTPEALMECASIRLFVDRAQSVQPDFQLTEGNAAAVAELCQRLEGIPLALELAATRAQVLTPGQMLAQLDNRFGFLVSRKRDAIERHRTLRATVDWSYRLLSPELQRFFARLSVFRGGWTMEAAEAVCQEPGVFEGLLDLCDHSLVFTREHQGTMRYHMLETIREFASEALDPDAAETLCEGHAHHFLSFAQDRASRADGPEEAEAFAELEADLGNIRAAMDWALDSGRDQLAAEFAGAIGDFLWRRGYWQEHSDRVAAGLTAAQRLSPSEPILVARLLHSLTRVAYDRGEVDSAETTCRTALDLVTQAQDPRWQGTFLNLMALILMSRGETEEAQRVLDESLPLFDAAGDARGEGMALHNLGVLAYSSGDRDTARQLYEQALPIRQQGGDVRGAAETQNNLALLAEEAGQFDVAEDAYRETLRSFMMIGDVLLMAVALCNLGEIALRTGRAREALDLLGPAEHTLEHLGSVHAAHASECLNEAAVELQETPRRTEVPWRQALTAAAQRALQG